MTENINDVIRIDTDAWKKDLPILQRETIEIFTLVPETHVALRSKLPDFDFSDPPVDPNSNSSKPPSSTASTQSSLSNYFSQVPSSSSNSSSEKCPPCPSCARCPEPAFECKKVPNYNSSGSSQYLPMPVVSDFSSFGM
jgi:hypothetical protein